MAWQIVEINSEYVVVRNDGNQEWTYVRLKDDLKSLGFDFESLFKIYPHAPGRSPGKATGMKRLKRKITTKKMYDKFVAALNNLIKEVESGARDREYVPMWQTFCGSKWEDYLPENLIEDEGPLFS